MGRAHGTWWLVLALGAGSGCGDDEGGPADAGSDAQDGQVALDAMAPEPPAAPEPPVLPVLLPCPSGWREVADSEDPAIVGCDPWPASGHEVCATDEAHFPGTSGCERVGTACPARGEWAADLPADVTILFVDAAAPEGGDGSREGPFARIADALDAGPAAPYVVALAAGTYEEAPILNGPVTLWGACVAETELRNPAGDPLGLTVAMARGAGLRNLSVTGTADGIFVGGTDPAVIVESVVVRDVVGVGVAMRDRGVLSARDLVVRDVAPSGADWGAGMEIRRDNWADLTRVSIERVARVGIQAAGVLHATDLAVTGTVPGLVEGVLDQGVGLFAADIADVEIERAVFADNGEVGVVAGELASLDLADTVVRDTAPRVSDGTGGAGIFVIDDATAAIRRTSVTGNHAAGISLAAAGVTLADVIVADTRPRQSDGIAGNGLEAVWGAIEIDRMVLLRNAQLGLFVSGETTVVLARDLVVRETVQQSHPDGSVAGAGIGLIGSARLELARALLQANDDTGIFVDTGATFLASDVTIEDTGARLVDTPYGQGLVVRGGAAAELARALLDENRTTGITVLGAGTRLLAEDVRVRGMVLQAISHRYGNGVVVAEGGAADLTRVALSETRNVGLTVDGEGSRATCEELDIVSTGSDECAGEGCTDRGTGIGVSASGGGAFEATRFRVCTSDLCGIQVAGGEVDLHDGLVCDNPIGVNLQTEGYDVNRLQEGVLYLDNDRSLDSIDLPVPDLSDIPDMGTPGT